MGLLGARGAAVAAEAATRHSASPAPPAPPATVMCGSLLKLNRRGRSLRTSWSRRWFVIRGGELAYYRYRRGSSGARVLPLASIHSVTKVSRQHVFGMPVLQLCADNRTLYVRAEDNATLNRWFHALTLQTRLWRRAARARLERAIHNSQNVGGTRACGSTTSSSAASSPALVLARALASATARLSSVDICRDSIGEQAGELLVKIHQFEMQMQEQSSAATARSASSNSSPVGQHMPLNTKAGLCSVSVATGSPQPPLPPRRKAWAQPQPQPQSS